MSFGRESLAAAAISLSLIVGAEPAGAQTPIRLPSPTLQASLLADVDGGLSPADQARFAALLNGSTPGARQSLFAYLALIPQNQRAGFAGFLFAKSSTERAELIDRLPRVVAEIQREQEHPEETRDSAFVALKQRRPTSVILGEVDAQLSPEEIHQFHQLLDASTASTRAALIDFIGELANADYDYETHRYSLRKDPEGAFVSELLERGPKEQANIIGFISRLNAEQRTGAAGVIATQDIRGGDQWENFLQYLGWAAPEQSFATLFPVDPMARMFAVQFGYSPDEPLWIHAADDADTNACKAASEAGDAAAPTICKWQFMRPEPEVSNGEEAPDIPWQVEIYRVGDAASNRFTAADLQSEQVNYGAKRADQDRDEACGGVLIPDNWVLTAAHCIYVPGKPLDWVLHTRRARTGTNSLRSGGTTWKIAGVVVHAGYDPRLIRNDIALIKIEPDGETKLSENRKAHPIELPPANAPVPDGTPLLLAGWGMTGEIGIGAVRDVHGKARTKSLQLLAATLTKIPLNQCQENKNYRHEHYVLGEGQICALGQHNQDACEGDSGGPLVHQVHGWARLVGIVSFGPGCGLDDTASIYTDIAYFRGWIDEAVKNLKPGQVVKWAPSPAGSAKVGAASARSGD